MGGTCGALGWERGERRHKRKGLGGYMWSARLGASVGRATDVRLTDGPPNLKRASDWGLQTCNVAGAIGESGSLCVSV